jgi:hypothetical protein
MQGIFCRKAGLTYLDGDPRREEPSQRIVVQIHAKYPIYSHFFKKQSHISSRNGFSFDLSVLTTVSIIRNHCGDVLGPCPSQGGHHKDQFHDSVVTRSGAHDIAVFGSHRILNFDTCFTIRKLSHVDSTQVNTQQVSRISSEFCCTRSTKEHEFLCHSRLNLRRSIEVHFARCHCFRPFNVCRHHQDAFVFWHSRGI